MDKGREQLNKLLTDQYRQYRMRMNYIGFCLRWRTLWPQTMKKVKVS